MRKGVALWLIVLSLVLTRLTGLHLHACMGAEAGIAHAGTHYADEGFLFGEHHAQDDADDREMDLVTIAVSGAHIDLDDLVTPIPASPKLTPMADRLLAIAAPRGPPDAAPSHPRYLTPPLRGPPHSLA